MRGGIEISSCEEFGEVFCCGCQHQGYNAAPRGGAEQGGDQRPGMVQTWGCVAAADSFEFTQQSVSENRTRLGARLESLRR